MKYTLFYISAFFACSAQAQEIDTADEQSVKVENVEFIQPSVSQDSSTLPIGALPIVLPAAYSTVDYSFPGSQDPDFKRKQRNATRWEIGYQVLNLVDAVQTAECLDRGVCEEANPLFRYTIGKRPSPMALIGTKALFGAAHWLLFSQLRKTNPDRAAQMARWSFGLQGGMIMVNARITF